MAGGESFWLPPSSSGGSALATKAYSPASEATYNSSGTMAAVDTTNLRLSFTVPASGKVIVVLTAMVAIAGDGEVRWGVLSGGSTVTGSVSDVKYVGGNTRISHRALISGLTVGATATWDWAHQTAFGTGGSLRCGGNRGQALMEIWSA